jgi:predicted nucleotidyltransferase
MTRQTILDRLNAEAPGLRRKYGVKSLAVFGSIARGDDQDGSDVDVLVKFEGKATFDNFMGSSRHHQSSASVGVPGRLRANETPLHTAANARRGSAMSQGRAGRSIRWRETEFPDDDFAIPPREALRGLVGE